MQALSVTYTRATSANIAENTNLYFTNTRVATKIDSYVDKAFVDNLSVVAASATGNAGSATVLQNARTIAGVSFNGSANISLDTSNITEDSSYLYFTSSRANSAIDARVDKAFVDASKCSSSAASGNAATATALATARTIAGVSFDGSANIALDTADITEDASALYFTNARARSALSVSGSLAYNSGTGVISFTQRTNAEVQALITAGTGVTVSSGQVSIGQAVATSEQPIFCRTYTHWHRCFTNSSRNNSSKTYSSQWLIQIQLRRCTIRRLCGWSMGCDCWGWWWLCYGDQQLYRRWLCYTAFTLSSCCFTSEDNLIAFIEGVYQNKSDFVASGTTITFDTAPVSGRNIVVYHIRASISGSSVIQNAFTGDGSDTTFTLSVAPQSENNTQVYLNGVYQNKDTYSVSGTTLTFSEAPANTVAIEVIMFAQTSINEPAAGTVGITQLNVSDGTSGQVLSTNGSGTLSFATVSGTTINNNADNRIITGSGTANTLNGESGLTYDGSTLAVTGTATIGDHLLFKQDGGNDQIKSTGSVLYVKANEYSFQDNSGNSRLDINSSGNVLVGASGAQLHIMNGTTIAGNIGRLNSEMFLANGSTGLRFIGALNSIVPCDGGGANRDNAIDWGYSSVRFDDIYATNGTIQTSDRNEKQDIAELSNTETRVAVAAKGLLRKFRWKDAIAEKGDEARTHFGIIAQDLQDAFTAEGLDAGEYAMFISSTWTNDDGEEQTRLGVRYSELLAFIIAAI